MNCPECSNQEVTFEYDDGIQCSVWICEYCGWSNREEIE